MSLTTISNGKYTAVICDKGAELYSLKAGGIEYIWQADAAYWNRHAPVLFPFVGRCKGDSYTYGDASYKMKQHGFARDNVFEVERVGETSASFVLRSNPELKKIYPFDFELHVEYRLGGAGLEVVYTVKNNGGSVMFYSIGSHEAYRCPLVEGERFEDYRLRFGTNERLDRFYLDDGLTSRDSDPFIDFGQEMALKHEYFYRSVAVLKNLRSTSVTLKSRVSGHGVEVRFAGFKNFGVWQAKDAPFLALEPWNGISDEAAFFGTLPTKTDILRLNAGASQVFTHSIHPF